MKDTEMVKAATICAGKRTCEGCPLFDLPGEEHCRWAFAKYIADHAGDIPEDPLLKRFHEAPAGTATRELVSALIEANPGKVKVEITL